MKIKITCPHCSQRIEAPGDVIGTICSCPKCEKGFHVGQKWHPSILDHLSKIDKLAATNLNNATENAFLGTNSGGSAFSQGFAAGNLHSDVFGSMFTGNSPFSVGHLKHPPGTAGDLHTDKLGNVYSGNSPLPVGRSDAVTGHEGNLHNDVFGHVYVGDDPFPVGELNDHEHQ